MKSGCIWHNILFTPSRQKYDEFCLKKGFWYCNDSSSTENINILIVSIPITRIEPSRETVTLSWQVENFVLPLHKYFGPCQKLINCFKNPKNRKSAMKNCKLSRKKTVIRLIAFKNHWNCDFDITTPLAHATFSSPRPDLDYGYSNLKKMY